MGEWLVAESQSLMILSAYAGVAMVAALPAALWSLVLAVLWCARPHGRDRLRDRYPLRGITWALCLPLILELFLFGYVALAFDWFEVLILLLIAGCITVIVAAHRVRGRGSRSAAFTMVAVAGIVCGGVALPTASWAASFVTFGFESESLLVLMPFPVVCAGLVNALFAVAQVSAAPVPAGTAAASAR